MNAVFWSLLSLFNRFVHRISSLSAGNPSSIFTQCCQILATYCTGVWRWRTRFFLCRDWHIDWSKRKDNSRDLVQNVSFLTTIIHTHLTVYFFAFTTVWEWEYLGEVKYVDPENVISIDLGLTKKTPKCIQKTDFFLWFHSANLSGLVWCAVVSQQGIRGSFFLLKNSVLHAYKNWRKNSPR